jgi:hypothetical protein
VVEPALRELEVVDIDAGLALAPAVDVDLRHAVDPLELGLDLFVERVRRGA